MSRSDSDSFISGEEDSPVRSIAAGLLSARPTFVKNSKSKAKTVALRAKINKCRSAPTARGSSRIEGRKQLEDHFKELVTDIGTLARKFETVLDCVSEILNSLDSLESRLEALESSAQSSDAHVIASLESRLKSLETSTRASVSHESYAGIARAQPDDQRVDKLEYKASEDERHKRSLEVKLTHPDINNDDGDLKSLVTEFLSTKMEMEAREIDMNLRVRKIPRDNTVLLAFSDRRFKQFIFAARKRLRQSPENNDINGLYISDNLTSYNYSIFKDLKNELKRREGLNLAGLSRVYCFEGKVYIKKDSSVQHGKCVSSKRDLKQLLEELNNESS